MPWKTNSGLIRASNGLKFNSIGSFFTSISRQMSLLKEELYMYGSHLSF